MLTLTRVLREMAAAYGSEPTSGMHVSSNGSPAVGPRDAPASGHAGQREAYPTTRDLQVCLDELIELRRQRDDIALSLKERAEACFAIEQTTQELVLLRQRL